MKYPPHNLRLPVLDYRSHPDYNLHVYTIDYLDGLTLGIKPLREFINPKNLADHPSRNGDFNNLCELQWAYTGGPRETGEFYINNGTYRDRKVKISDLATKILEKSLEKDLLLQGLKKLLEQERVDEINKLINLEITKLIKERDSGPEIS